MHTTHAHGAETGLMHTALAQSSSTDAAAAAARSATKRKGSPALATHDNDAHDGNRGSSAFLLPPPGADLLLQSNELLSSSSSHVTAHTPPHASTAALLLPEAIATAPKAKPSRKAPANPPASNGPTNSSGSAAKRKKPRTKPPAQTDSAALLSSSPSSGDPSSGQPVSPPVVLDTTTIEPKEIPHDAVLHLQTKQCMVAAYGKSPRCRSCIRKNGDSCRFKQFRAFVESPTDKSLSYGPYFVDGQHPIVAEFEASLRASPRVQMALCNSSNRHPSQCLRICTTCYDEWDEAALADGRPTLLTRDHGFKIAQLLLAHCMPTPDFNRVYPALPRLYSRPAEVNASEAAVLDKEHQIGGDIDVTNDSGDYVRIPWAAGDDARSLGRLEQDWARRMPIVLEIPVGDMQELWAPSVFAREFGTEVPEMVDCTPGIVVDGISIQSFFDGFGCAAKRPLDSQGNPMVLKLKDWPGDMDLKDKMASHYHSLVSRLPLPDFHCRNGALNLASRIPPEAQTLDLGPKLYIAPSSTSSPSSPTPVAPPHLESSTPPSTSASLSPASTPPQSRTGAVWDIYPAQAAPALRAFITQVSIERNLRIDDPIHDQRWYLDAPMRERLYREYGVRGWRIHQRPGDVIYVPAGSPHKSVAMDYMSPYHVEQSVGLTREFRRLGSTHHRKSDLLQPKNVLYHAWVDCMAALHRGDCDPAGTALPAPSASGSAEPAV
ncbi:hypothetical protein BC831DRAFT_475991 [Entophlyctis helioformis]|nr:hypothetical protein BC831DRAFT_475991 [Entophlyctis helioformis]